MEIEKLAAMANQIASFFRSYPEAEALVGIRGHIADFWTPKMRAELQAGGVISGLDPLVVRALNLASPDGPASQTELTGLRAFSFGR